MWFVVVTFFLGPSISPVMKSTADVQTEWWFWNATNARKYGRNSYAPTYLLPMENTASIGLIGLVYLLHWKSCLGKWVGELCQRCSGTGSSRGPMSSSAMFHFEQEQDPRRAIRRPLHCGLLKDGDWKGISRALWAALMGGQIWISLHGARRW